MMSRKKSSGWTMAKALYVLPIAAFAAIAFANCSKTESEITKNRTQVLTDEQYQKIVDLARELGIQSGELPAFMSEDGNVYTFYLGEDGILTQIANEEIKKELIKDEYELIEFDNKLSEDVFLIVEEMPEFPGGEIEMRKFIAMNVQYPDEAKQKNIQGKVFVQFVVNKEGNVEDVKIARGVDPLLDQAAMDAVKLMPKWKPGKQSGEIVKVGFTIPISFQLGRKNIQPTN